MKIRGIISHDLDLDLCYPSHLCDPKQYSRSFSYRLDTLDNVNAGSGMTYKPYNSKST